MLLKVGALHLVCFLTVAMVWNGMFLKAMCLVGVLPGSRADATFKDQGLEGEADTLDLLASGLSIHTPSLFPGCPEVSSLLGGRELPLP